MRFATASVCAGLAMTGCKKLAGYRRRGEDTPPNILFTRQCGGPMGALTSTQGARKCVQLGARGIGFYETQKKSERFSLSDFLIPH